MDTATDRRPTRHLPDALAGLLDRLIAERPSASHAQIAAIFAARTGREIDRHSVGYRKRRAARGLTPGRYHLTSAQQRTLAFLIREGEGEASDPEVAAAFEAIEGRPISAHAVGDFRGRVLAIAPTPQARHGKAAGRIDSAGRAKLAKHKPDRSPRVAKSGRYTA